MRSVVVKFVVVVTVVICLFGPKVTKVDTEKEVMTVWDGAELELLVGGEDD
jgi:hypothetical protein